MIFTEPDRPASDSIQGICLIKESWITEKDVDFIMDKLCLYPYLEYTELRRLVICNRTGKYSDITFFSIIIKANPLLLYIFLVYHIHSQSLQSANKPLSCWDSLLGYVPSPRCAVQNVWNFHCLINTCAHLNKWAVSLPVWILSAKQCSTRLRNAGGRQIIPYFMFSLIFLYAWNTFEYRMCIVIENLG